MVVAVALLLGAAVGFNYYEEYHVVLRALAVIGVAGLAIFIALQTVTGRNAFGFVRDARTEVRKVVWPTRAEAMQTTLVVMAMVILVALILWLMDSVLLVAIRFLTGQGD